MRISDWSSDVCSSDLGVGFAGVKGFVGGFGRGELGAFGESAIKGFVEESINEARKLENALRSLRTERTVAVLHYAPVVDTVQGEPPEIFPFLRSEEHTSELQSLMRNSYAVFCLKKKTHNSHNLT